MNEIESNKNGLVSDQTSNLENRNWIDAGSSPVEVKCECCGKEIKDFNSKRFCSIHCRQSFIAKHVKNRVNNLPKVHGRGDWTCKECGSIFETKNKLYEHRHEKHNLMHVRKGAPQQHIKTLCKCEFCGLEKEMSKESFTKHKKYCKCNPNRAIWKGHSQSEETKQKLSALGLQNGYRRLMRKTQLYNGILYDSSWEVELAKRLESLNEVFERPESSIKYVGADGKEHNYFPDFYLPKRNIFVEVKNPYLFENDSKVQILKAERSDIIWLTSLEQIQKFIL